MEIKRMETDDEIRGKACVHWSAWHDAYPGLVSAAFLEKMMPEACERIAFNWRDGVLVAKDGDCVVGFAGYGEQRDAPGTGGIFALYVLKEYRGQGVGRQLMDAALEKLKGYGKVCLWVLKENERAIAFYRKCGFVPDGEEKYEEGIGAWEIRMERTALRAE